MRRIFTLLSILLCTAAYGQVSQVAVLPNLFTPTGTGIPFNNTTPAVVQNSDNVYTTATDIPDSGTTVSVKLLNTTTSPEIASIPNDALIAGFVINIRARSVGDLVRASIVQTTMNNGLTGTNMATATTFPLNKDSTITYGSPTSLLGQSFNGATLRNAAVAASIVVQFYNTSATQLASIAIDQITIAIYYNRKPVAGSDIFTVDSVHHSFTGNIRSNDTDPETPTAQLITSVATAPTVGTLALNNSGQFTYTPPANFTGGNVQFTYRVRDNGSPSNNTTSVVTLTYPHVSMTILPVNVSSFTAQRAPNGVQLAWTVGAEANVNRYEVERSTNGYQFTTIGTVTATGNRDYRFTDVQSVKGTAYYRVRNVDNNGDNQYTAVQKYDHNQAATVLKAIPSVTTGAITLQHPLVTDNGLFTLSNAAGKTVQTFTPALNTSTTPVDVSGYPAGVYFLTLHNTDGQIKTIRIIKR
jgi:hypothetical protein